MSKQPDLFVDAPLTITPSSGDIEPRLWVRRLTLWNVGAD